MSAENLIKLGGSDETGIAKTGYPEKFMRNLLCLVFFVPGFLLAQTSQPQTSFVNSVVSGRWLVTADFYGAPINFSLELNQQGNKLTGSFDGNKLEGFLEGNSIHFRTKDAGNRMEECTATVQGGTISGIVVLTDTGDSAHPSRHQFTAKLAPQRRAGAPRRFEFVPRTFYRQFSANNKPVLAIFPGDTLHTTTVDSEGTDEKGVTRVLGGNPQTGPFYVETSAPGDTLVVHLTRLRLNRDWAVTDDALVDRALDGDLAVKMKDGGKTIRWHLDVHNGLAAPEKALGHLARYSVPLRPMLGCIGLAPSSTEAAPSTGDSGSWGGNMDFNEIVQGSTVYLPVSVPGALLYIGDGHAAEGDGEITDTALETSMEVELTVDVIPGKNIMGPRVQSATHIMAMGLAGSLDDAFRMATASMAQWLTDDYKLTPSEVAQVLGTSAEYKVSEVADRNAGVVLKIDKERLRPLVSAVQ
jgi:amidase